MIQPRPFKYANFGKIKQTKKWLIWSSFQVQKCNSTVQKTVVVFQGDSVSSAANMARGAIEDFIASEVQNLLCQSATESTKFYESEVVVKESSNPSICGEEEQQSPFNFSQPGLSKLVDHIVEKALLAI